MATYCKICSNSCEEVNPMPLSSFLMETCNAACNGHYGQDDMRCFLFCFTPCSFVMDILSWCPRCMVKCCKDIKEKKSNNKVNSEPTKTIVSEPV